MFTPKGRFGWYELMTSDTEAAAKFYSDVIGWETQVMPNPQGTPYTVFQVAKSGVAGMLGLPGHVAWIGYIAVEDVDAHVEHIVAEGGKLLRPTADVPGMLRFAVVSDPQGAAFVVFTPNPAMPSQTERPESPTPGTIGWHELHTADLEAGFGFYQKLFGWSKITDMDMGPFGIYRLFDEGTHPEMGDGGMMNKMPDVPVSFWMFYFCVDAVGAAVARVEAGGGKVLVPPRQIPGGGWIATASDPQGAMFSVTSSQA